MKRWIAIILCAVFMLSSFGLAGCGSAEVSAPRQFNVGAGLLRCFAVDERGSAYYWGLDFGSEETLGTEDFSTIPQHLVTEPQLVTDCVSSVFATDCSALFLKEDGSLWILGTPTMTGDFCAPEPVWLMDNVVSADLSGSDILAVDGDGTLWTFKNSLSHPVELLEDIAYVSAHTGGGWYAVGRDGSLWERDSDECVMKKVAAATGSSGLSAAVKTDGSLWVWGKAYSEKPKKLAKGVIYAEAFEAGEYSSGLVYITEKGELWMLGYDLLEDKTYDEPQKIMDGVAMVDAYSSLLVISKTDGTVLVRGDNAFGALCTEDLTASGMAEIPLP